MKIPRWFVDGNRLFRIKEYKETKKTYIIQVEGLKGIRQFKKRDRRLNFKKYKPYF